MSPAAPVARAVCSRTVGTRDGRTGAGKAGIAAGLLLACLLAPAGTLLAQEAPGAAFAESSWDLGGKLLHRSALLWTPGEGAAEGSLAYSGSTALEATLRARGPGARGEASVELALAPGAAPAFAARTLFARIDLGEARLTAGRQVVNYGRGAVWSPVDLFSELDLTGLAVARRGVDALRFQAPLGALGGFDLVAAPTAEPAAGRYALRASGLVGGSLEAGAVAARDGDVAGHPGGSWSLGGDFKADLGAALYGEVLWSRPSDGGGDSLLAALGADWSLGDLVLAAEWYRNSGGAAADPLFPGRDYAMAGLSWAVSDFVALGLTAMADLGSGAGRLTASLAADLSQNSRAILYADAARGSFALEDAAGFSLAAGARIELSF